MQPLAVLLEAVLVLCAVGSVAEAGSRGLLGLGGRPVGLGPDGRAVDGKGGLVFPLRMRGGHIRGHRTRGLAANGTLPLHGAVKDLGYFYAEMKIGTPAKSFAVIVDTGSTMAEIPCSYCTSKNCGPNKMNAPYNPQESSTYQKIGCGTPQCKCGSPSCSCDSATNQCSYSRYYAESSSSSGHLLSDVLHLGDSAVRVSFGCETKETGEIYHQSADGIMGLGGSSISIPFQLADSGAIDPVFSLCFGDMQGEGALLIGDVPLPTELRMHHVPLVTNNRHPHYYNINMHGLSMGDIKLSIPESEWKKGYGVVLDSGTTFTYIPTQPFQLVLAALKLAATEKQLRTVAGPDPKYVDHCWGGAPLNPWELRSVFPIMKLHLDGDFVLELEPINYLFLHTSTRGAYCLGLFDNGSSGTLLGGITFRNILLQYDHRNGEKRVGIAHAPCRVIGQGGCWPPPETVAAELIGAGEDYFCDDVKGYAVRTTAELYEPVGLSTGGQGAQWVWILFLAVAVAGGVVGIAVWLKKWTRIRKYGALGHGSTGAQETSRDPEGLQLESVSAARP